MTELTFEFKNLRASTREWGSPYHVDCDVYVKGKSGWEFVTVYTYNPWWKIERKMQGGDRNWNHDKTEVKFKTGEKRKDGFDKHTILTIDEPVFSVNLFFGQHWGKRLTDEAAKRIRDKILVGLEGEFPAEIQPERADVIDCLVLDSETLDYSFGNWCDSCGYDSDSISALETYNECCKTGRKLIKMGIWKELKEEWEKNNE
jgi:hypothetical protein